MNLILNQSKRSDKPGIVGDGNHAPQILPGRGDRLGWFARFFALASADDMTAEGVKAESESRKAEEFLVAPSCSSNRQRPGASSDAAGRKAVGIDKEWCSHAFNRGNSRLAAAGLASCVMKLGRPLSFLRQGAAATLLVGPQRGHGTQNRRVFGRLGQLLVVNGGLQ